MSIPTSPPGGNTVVLPTNLVIDDPSRCEQLMLGGRECLLRVDGLWRITYLGRSDPARPDDALRWLGRDLFEALPSLAAAPESAVLRAVLADQEPSSVVVPGPCGLLLTAYPCDDGLALVFRRPPAPGSPASALDEHLRQALSEASVGVALVGEAGTLLWANRSLARLLGCDEQALVGRRFSEAFPPTHFPTLAHSVRRLAVGAIDSYAAEGVCPDPSGRFAALRLKGYAVRGADGGLLYQLCQVRDVSLRRDAEAQAELVVGSSGAMAPSLTLPAAMRSLVELVVEHLSEWCVLEVGGHGAAPPALEVAARDPQREAVLKRFLAGAASPRPGRGGRQAGAEVWSIGPAGQPPHADAPYAAAFRAAGIERVASAPLMDGPWQVGTLYVVAPEPGTDGSRDLFLLEGVARRAAQALRRAAAFAELRTDDGDQADRAALVAHDLHSPLTAISMITSLLLEQDFGEEERRRLLSVVLRSAQHIEHLAADLAGESPTQPAVSGAGARPFDVARLTEEVVEVFERLALARGVRMDVIAPGGLPRVFASREGVARVMYNLIENALRVTPAGGYVAVSLRSDGPEVSVSVADTGPGVGGEEPADLSWHGMEPVHARLGVAVAEAHHGRISVQTLPGAGSTFTLVLPTESSMTTVLDRGAAATPAAPQRHAEEPEPAAGPAAGARYAGESAGLEGRRIRVLVADVHPAFRSGLARSLAREPDLEVVGIAGSGEEALALVHTHRPDVVLMDLDLPGGAGGEAIRQIVEYGAGTRVLGITGDSARHGSQEALAAGAAGYLTKTMTVDQVANAVRAVAGGSVILSVPAQARAQAAAEPEPAAVAAAPPRPPRGPTLTATEEQILSLTAAGHSSAEIARRLFFSPQTIDTYRSRAVRRLGLKTRAELIRFVLDHDLFVRD